MIPYGRQNIDRSDINEVIKVLKSDFITQGPTVPKFEEKIKKHCNANYALVTNSATSSLHLACLSLGVTSGDIVWTSPITFVASSNCARYCGANIDFVDINPETYNLSVDELEKKLIQAKKNNNLPKVLIVVHMAGYSCDMKRISELANLYHFKIIEDASHSIGGLYRNNHIGSCEYSDAVVFSFHPVKMITTGEGGAVLTNDKELYEIMFKLRVHGITKNKNQMLNPENHHWYYEQLHLGYNYRMTDIQAALGISQLKKLNVFMKKRQEIANIYDELFTELPVKTQRKDKNIISSNHLYIIRIDKLKIKRSHGYIFNFLIKNNIGVNLHYIPVYRHPYYKQFGYNFKNFPESEKYYSEAISLPIHTKLNLDDISKIVDLVGKSFE
jgi:UDP-4-amino-4,6-dideoxy-N-acetyl-beta-L-altrosamine transaminase